MAEDDFPASGPDACGPVPVLPFGARRERTVDEHMYRPLPDRPECSLRLQLFTAAGERTVAVVTQVFAEGMGLTTGVEQYAAAVWEQWCPQEVVPPLWVQRQLLGDGPAGEQSVFEDEPVWELPGFELVEFGEVEPYRLGAPRWWPITAEEVERLVGGPVDAGRGGGYVAPVPEPEPEQRFEVMEVARLGVPSPFRTAGCMPAGAARPPGRGRRLARAIGGRGCCWYHEGDWRPVAEFAVGVLAEGVAAGIGAEGMAAFALRRAREDGLDSWQRQALDSLFGLDSAITPDGAGGFVNGQHRSRAMLDQEVQRTVVLMTVASEG
ncbi:hypothetical protein [Kitasatospora sp. NPDC088134]|uniref:hypothetical protein n=1 Tax=Kitasatospora sp. NPDC088134 TaxID=3364071 RepID=UPI003809CBEE